MSLIKNLIKEEKQTRKKKTEDEDKDEEKEKPVIRQIKSATDLQRFKLEKLMNNPEKLIEIPPTKQEKDYMKTVPDFVRNVMGSSAGAGSGEFHVYRHLRRKEYSRQKIIEAQSQREQLDQDYQNKLDDNKRKAEDRTAKKRAKRLKRKAKKTRGHNTDKSKQDTKEEEPSSEEEPASDEADDEQNKAEDTEQVKETVDAVKDADKTSSEEKVMKTRKNDIDFKELSI